MCDTFIVTRNIWKTNRPTVGLCFILVFEIIMGYFNSNE